MENNYQRGSIYWLLNNSKSTGSEQHGIRPVIIVSNNKNNEHSPIVTIVPVTSQYKTKLPVHVLIPSLTQPTGYNLVLCEQIMTVSKTRLVAYRGLIEEAIMKRINRALAIQLNLMEIPQALNKN